jgi:branched-chain amino acid transport system substrate-binding protein
MKHWTSKVAAALAAAAVLSQGAAAQVMDGAELRIAGIFGLTGVSNPFGKGELDAVTLAVEEWNAKGGIAGKKLVLQAEDHHTEQMKVVSAFKKLVDVDGHTALLGPTWLDTFQSIIPLAERKQILLLTPSAAVESFERAAKTQPFALSTYFRTRNEIKVLLDHLASQGKKKVVAAYDQDPYFQLLKRLINETAPECGVEIVQSDDFQMGETDFRTYLARLRKSQPQAILFMQQREETVLSFFRQRRELFPESYVAGIHDLEGFLQNDQMKALAGDIDFTYFKIADPGFSKRFETRFGYAPILTASNAYDAANMLFEALNKGAKNGVEIRDYLLSNEFQTVTFGATKFAPDGSMTESEMGVKRFSGGALKTLF